MKRLIWKLPLIVGCLLLAWVVIFLFQDMTEYYEKDESVWENACEQGDAWLSEEERIISFAERSRKGLCYIADSFIYAYNECGYYDGQLPYMKTDKVEQIDVQCGYVLLYLMAVLLMLIPILIGNIIFQVYVLTGGVLAIILLLGVVPQYENLVFLIGGWIYMNLIKNWMNMKGMQSLRQFIHEFPLSFVPCYMILIIIAMLLPILIPAENLPEADKETKELIFSHLQEISLVSNQYEENQRLKQEQQKNDINNMDDMDRATKEPTEETDDFTDSDNFPKLDDKQQGTENLQEKENDFQEGENLQAEKDRQTVENLQQKSEGQEGGMGISGKDGLGFALNSGGGVSGGRTDRTGNLSFRGETVLTVTMDSRPQEDLYIRLFYAEKYEDNRWKQTEEEHFIDTSIISFVTDYDGDGQQDFTGKDGFSQKTVLELTMPAFYSLKDGGGDSGIASEFLKLAYAGDSSKITVFGSSELSAVYYPEKAEYLNNVCLKVPEELTELFRDNFSQIFLPESESLSDEEIVSGIEQLLDDQAYYTLSPGSVPENKDFITWFLMENRKGYCMHFASAGVMMLREAGICSRYAEGYFVPSSAWNEQEDGTWSAEVKDSNAHAWAEIFQEGVDTKDSYPSGCWIPVEMTPAYDGELAGVFAGQQDTYAERIVIPGIIIWTAKTVARILCVIFPAAGGIWFCRKVRLWKEYRMLHTGEERQDIQNMMKILIQKLMKKDSQVRNILMKNNLSQKELNEKMTGLVPELGQDKEAAECFKKFSDYVYKAAFASEISRKDRKEAYLLYRKLREKLNIG